MANKISYGLNNVHYAIKKVSELGVVTYDKPVRIPGAVSMAISPTGDNTNFYADNGIYYSINSNTGYEGTLSMALIPQKFKIDVLGERLVNGMLAEFSDAKQTDIALLFEVDGDSEVDRFVYYDVSVARPQINAETTAESITINPSELTLTVKPRNTDKAVKAIASPPTVADPTGAYAKFFDEVQEPVVTKSLTK